MTNNDLQQLPDGATDAELEAAAAFNHTELFCLNALSVGGTVHSTNGVRWTDGGKVIESMIAFPSLHEGNAKKVLDEIVQYYLDHPPKGVGCWSVDPPQPKDLGVMLLARGFQPGWHPNWMALDLSKLNQDHPRPEKLEVEPDNNTALEKIKGLPYGGTEIKIFSQQPKGGAVLQRFIARLNNKVVAHCSVLLTSGPLGSAGVYHVGVIPKQRNRGIGKAVVSAACKYAKELGYNYALLNGTGDKMYEQLGFRKLGKGHTWWLVTSRLIAHPPSETEIELAEAIGRSDTDALEIIGDNITNYDLFAPLTNGLTLMQLAVHCQQPVSAKWLISFGLAINVIEAWDLGWKDLAAKLIAEHPGQVNIQHGEGAVTILHTAAERGDIELARLALSANPNLDLKDKHYNSTALDWAKHLHMDEIATLIENYLATKPVD